MTHAAFLDANDVMPRIPHHFRRYLFLAAIVVGLLVALLFYQPPQRGLWPRVFFDWLHVPVFGIIAASIYFLRAGNAPWQNRVLVAFAGACVLGLISEAAQVFTSRDASFKDLVADCLGAAAFVAAAVAIRPAGPMTPASRLALSVAAIVLLGWTMIPLATVTGAYVERYAQLPKIFSPDSRFGSVLTRRQNIRYEILPETRQEPAHARVTFGAAPWPGVAYHDIWPDWSGYSTLVLRIENDGDTDVDINFRVHDRQHETTNAYSDRFTRGLSLAPGVHTIEVPLSDIVNAPRTRTMDIRNISEIIVFAREQEAGRTIRLYGIWLE